MNLQKVDCWSQSLDHSPNRRGVTGTGLEKSGFRKIGKIFQLRWKICHHFRLAEYFFLKVLQIKPNIHSKQAMNSPGSQDNQAEESGLGVRKIPSFIIIMVIFMCQLH